MFYRGKKRRNKREEERQTFLHRRSRKKIGVGILSVKAIMRSNTHNQGVKGGTKEVRDDTDRMTDRHLNDGLHQREKNSQE